MTRAQTRIATVCFATLAAACNGRPSPTSSTPPMAPSAPSASPGLGPTSGPNRVTGQVVERTAQGVHPLSDVSVNLWVEAGNYGYSYWWANGQVHSDADGRFQLPNLPRGSGWLQAYKDGYAQQCAVPAGSLDTNPNLEVALIARAHLLTDPASVPASVPGRIVTGRILESDSSGMRPVAGAYVDFEQVSEDAVAITYSDNDGRYLLCGVTDGTIGVYGSDSSYTYVPVPRDQGLSVSLDITLH